jgi:hypothetical protein
MMMIMMMMPLFSQKRTIADKSSSFLLPTPNRKVPGGVQTTMHSNESKRKEFWDSAIANPSQKKEFLLSNRRKKEFIIKVRRRENGLPSAYVSKTTRKLDKHDQDQDNIILYQLVF